MGAAQGHLAALCHAALPSLTALISFSWLENMRFLTAAFAIILPLMLLLFCVTVKSHLIKVLPILSAAELRSADACVISRLCPGKLLSITDGAVLEDVTQPRWGLQALPDPHGSAAALAHGVQTPGSGRCQGRACRVRAASRGCQCPISRSDSDQLLGSGYSLFSGNCHTFAKPLMLPTAC